MLSPDERRLLQPQFVTNSLGDLSKGVPKEFFDGTSRGTGAAVVTNGMLESRTTNGHVV